MYDDFEADFWKEHFIHLLHKNMVRLDAQKLTFENFSFALDSFKSKMPNVEPNVNFYSNYATFEVFVTQNIKLRLFVQNQIKASLLQFDGGDYVKIADAKFPYNPFYEIVEFLQHAPEYEKELNLKLANSIHTKMQLKIAKQFILAYLAKRTQNKNDLIWTLEQQENKFKLTIKKQKSENFYIISPDNFVSEIEEIAL